MSDQPTYPYDDGDVTVLGPQIFASKDGAVISWRGDNYVPQSAPSGPAATEPTVDRQTAVVLAALHHSAEADVSRVIGLYERWVKAGPPPLGTSTSRWWDIRLSELHAAILPPEPADPTAAEQQLAAIVEVARTKGVISIDGIRAITDPPKERR